ncbi:MAG: hypothetical protein KAR20_29800, partial [Candidatus Heimdallarchaeota archaeon]|nr:hypothetical protein [Candidatus Heimdallarchaeota archaeon]
MVELTPLNEGFPSHPIESPSKIRRMPQCRLIAPTESIMFGKKKLKNIGKDPTIVCEISDEFTESKVLTTLEKQIWYPEYATMRQGIIDKCKVEGKIAVKKCESRDYISDHLLIGTDTDPFDTRNATHFRTRYVANLISKLYPKTKDDTHKFHARAVHYRLLSQNIGFPTFIKGEGWQISKYMGSQKQWDNLREGLTEARNARLIPFDMMVDRRVPFEIKPSSYAVGRARPDIFKPTINLDFK